MQNSKASLVSPTEFCFSEKPWEADYWTALQLFIAEYTILHRMQTPTPDAHTATIKYSSVLLVITEKQDMWLSLGFLLILKGGYKSIYRKEIQTEMD